MTTKKCLFKNVFFKKDRAVSGSVGYVTQYPFQSSLGENK